MSKKKETKEERSERRRKELRLALRVFRYFLPYKWAMVVALLASAVVSGTTAGTAWLIKPALDDIFIRQDGTALLYGAAGLHRTDGPERCRALPAKLVYALQRAARAGNHAAGTVPENHHPAPAFL